jgi:adenine-specific DNA methylase
MVTLTRAYTSIHEAETAAARLLSAGVPTVRIQLVMGRAIQDARDTPIGTFAATTTAGAATVGSFGNVALSARQAIGTFAGDPDKQRRGSYGDADRDTVTTYEPGVKRTRIASHRTIEKLLVDAGLDPAIATAQVDALHAGRVLVLVDGDSPHLDLAHPLRAAA